jgi:hypothetical protein
MKIVSYYSKTPDWIKHWWPFWEWAGGLLPMKFGELYDGEVTLMSSLKNDLMQQKRLKHFEPKEGNFDVAYCERYSLPTKRIADFVYTMIDDFVGLEGLVYEFIYQLRPNLLCTLSYYGNDLIEMCKKLDIKLLYFPWFIDKVQEYNESRDIVGMMTGCIGGAYKTRREIYDSLKLLDRADIILDCSESYGKYKMTRLEFLEKLRHARYYFSAGIHDRLIPLKFMEICSCGACLVTPKLPDMASCGFIDGETYINLKSPNEISEMLDSDDYRLIGKNAVRMIQAKHTINIRAHQLAEVIANVRVAKPL